MEVNFGSDEFYPDMSMGMPEDLMRAHQYNVSADLRCANSNNERPDWRPRGVSDPWSENPKFHDPSLRDRMARTPECGHDASPQPILSPDDRYNTRWLKTEAAAAKHDAKVAADRKARMGAEGGGSGSNEGFTIKESFTGDLTQGMPNNILILLLFAFIIYLVISCQAAVKKLKKEIKQLKMEHITMRSVPVATL